MTIEGLFEQSSPAGGGLNLAEISLNFSTAAAEEFGNEVASFVALGDNAAPATAGNAIDGDLQTHTTLGNTIGQDQRLRITLGFSSSSGQDDPDPAVIPTLSLNAMLLLLVGLLVTAFSGLRRNR